MYVKTSYSKQVIQNKLFKTLINCLVVLFLVGTATAQQFARVNDELRIEFAIDLIRKGVQQEDTLKVMSVFAEQVAVKGIEGKSNTIITQKLIEIFNNSSSRTFYLERSPYSKENNRLLNSHLWDFDILEPEIIIRGDSAFVDCELVLWGAKPDSTNKTGSKMKERFVFWSPPLDRTIPSGEGYHEWGSNRSKLNPTTYPKGWVLVSCDNLFSFLESYGSNNVEVITAGGQE